MSSPIGSLTSIHAAQGRGDLNAVKPIDAPSAEEVAKAKETKQELTQTFNTLLYGTLLQSMRKTVGEPAYFHGGRGEEVFRSQMDQQIADNLGKDPRSDLVGKAMEHQFPQIADVLRRHDQATSALGAADELKQATGVLAQTSLDRAASGLDQLSSLRRR